MGEEGAQKRNTLTVKAEAFQYFEHGFNVVAVFLEQSIDGKVIKKPLVEWSRWQKQRQTIEEFETQPWQNADGFGVVCSWPNKDGLFLAVVDYDVKKISEEAKKKGMALLRNFPVTQIEQTVSEGLHYVYLSRVKPSPISEYHDSHALELIAGPKICIMAPSEGYVRLNDNMPTVIEDAEALFYKALEVTDKREDTNKGVATKVLQKWLEQLKQHLKMAGEGNQYFYTHCPFHKPDNNPSFAIHKTKFYAIDYHDGKVYSIKELAEALGVTLQGAKNFEGVEYEEEKINLYMLANRLLEETPIATDIRTYLMFRWNGKYWVDDAEGVIHKRLVEEEGENYKPYHLTTLTQIIQALTFQNGLEEPPHNLICFENGVLDLATMELKPHSSKLFFRNIIHAEYNLAARAEEFLNWLKEVLPEEDAQKCVQEMFGYCLLRGFPFHFIFFLVGPGRNGKGTLVRTLISLLGKENCVSIPLERLPERFQATNLIGKLANVVSEPKTTLVTTETIKMLTGEDLITAEFKNKQKTVQFTNYAKLIVVANRLPPINDSSLAWWERVIVVEFPIAIPEDKRIPNIEEKWLNSPEERSGIINWALEGLKRLLENKRFTRSETMLNVVEQYKRWSQPAQYFLDKYCACGSNLWVTKKALYEGFKLVCEEEGLPIVSEEVFSREVRKKPRVMLVKKRIGGENQRVWIGISVKEETGQVGQVRQVFLSPKKVEAKQENNKESINFKSKEEPDPLASVAPISFPSNDELSHSGQVPTLYKLKDPEMFPTERCFKCGAKPVAFQVNYPDGSWGLLCAKCASQLYTRSPFLTRENVERIFNALAELTHLKSLAHESELVAATELPFEAVMAILEQLQREGKAVSTGNGFWKVV
ncbi:MAG: phage/plasmid primase, P4 family [Candidatus Bathyarchaeia archaeon]